MTTRFRTFTRLYTAILLTMALAFSGSAALADDDDDDNGVDDEPTAFLYAGTTADLDAATVVDEIDDLDNDDDDDDDNDWDKLGNDQDRPDGLLSTEDDIDDDLNLTVQGLVDGDYVIVVHAGESTDTPILVAGDVEGELEDGTLLIELQEVEASGFEGRALIQLDEDDDDDDENDIEITVGIYPAGSVETLPSPTPAG